jgi:outer membrane protein
MKNSIKSTLVAALVLVSSAAQAQPRMLSLDEAITLSLQNSHTVKLNQARIAGATASLREARERRLPDLNISGSYLRLNQPTVDLKVSLGGTGQSGTQQGGSGTGTTSGGSSITVDQAMYGMARLSLPVFAGFRIQHGVESAKYLEQAAKLDATQDRQEVIQNAIAAYSNMYKAKAALDIVKENLKQSQQRVADFSNLEQNGLMARNDLLKAQLQQSNIELALVDAENNWKITYINMNLMLGLDEHTEILPDSNAFVAIADDHTFEHWEAEALQNRKDLSALEYRRKAANAGIKAAQGEHYPSLALTVGYVAVDVPEVLTITNAVNGGVGLKYSPSSLWKTGSKVAQAKARMQEVEINRHMLSDAVRLQTAQAYQSYISGTKKIEVYAKAAEQANENYRIVKNKYDNALATTTDLLEADVAQLQARLNYAFAKADAMVAYNKLLETTGKLTNETK